MDNGQNMDSNELQLINYSMNSDSRKRPRSHSDIMSLRLKNRERQRRYRARKRLEADMKNSTQQAIEFESNGNINSFASRVYCNRDWKKDARRANEAPSDCPSIPAIMVENPILNVTDSTVQAELKFETSQSVCEKQKYVLNRRDWKAEARNKKNEGDLIKL